MSNDFFYSLDKLVEFGLGATVAAQMTQSMNSSIANMTTPGVDNGIQINGQSIYYAAIDDVAAGPYSATELARLIADGKVLKETYIWKPGMIKWDLAENLQDVLRLAALTPPPLPNE
ncbi:DUF4339 domain-containing protein [Adlercreutzia sp. ZJ141]|uniref:DUF4339 domain-containing protein n=1 Tax=Adlercreutzia sp. ZJ141 TaxID=2709406 RepID=UPI0013EC9902|nr:DUF4339 domain-containing protein [Adlercreutzia sp. ZJ141]